MFQNLQDRLVSLSHWPRASQAAPARDAPEEGCCHADGSAVPSCLSQGSSHRPQLPRPTGSASSLSCNLKAQGPKMKAWASAAWMSKDMLVGNFCPIPRNIRCLWYKWRRFKWNLKTERSGEQCIICKKDKMVISINKIKLKIDSSRKWNSYLSIKI